jgi:hypothetical protein
VSWDGIAVGHEHAVAGGVRPQLELHWHGGGAAYSWCTGERLERGVAAGVDRTNTHITRGTVAQHADARCALSALDNPARRYLPSVGDSTEYCRTAIGVDTIDTGRR